MEFLLPRNTDHHIAHDEPFNWDSFRETQRGPFLQGQDKLHQFVLDDSRARVAHVLEQE